MTVLQRQVCVSKKSSIEAGMIQLIFTFKMFQLLPTFAVVVGVVVAAVVVIVGVVVTFARKKYKSSSFYRSEKSYLKFTLF